MNTDLNTARNTLTTLGDDTVGEFLLLVRLGESAADIVANIPELGFAKVTGVGYVAPRHGTQGKVRTNFAAQDAKFIAALADSLR